MKLELLNNKGEIEHYMSSSATIWLYDYNSG